MVTVPARVALSPTKNSPIFSHHGPAARPIALRARSRTLARLVEGEVDAGVPERPARWFVRNKYPLMALLARVPEPPAWLRGDPAFAETLPVSHRCG